MIRFNPLWADSLGAKSFAVYIEAGSESILIDPGVAKMQPTYPASVSLKHKWWSEARDKIIDYMLKTKHIIITHYHHDHYLWMDEDIKFYEGKTLYIKNPNIFINDSQRERARLFIKQLIKQLIGVDFAKYLSKPLDITFKDPVMDYREALNLDFGDYNKRRNELLRKGRDWFTARTKVWRSDFWISEIFDKRIKVIFIDEQTFILNDLKLKFTKPLFHGIEYSRVGWVIGIVLEYLGDKLIYTSDIQGPIIEDYASWIINENPRIIILDGPPTYLIPYSMNLHNFRRTIKNLIRILKNTESLELILYDHHLTREPKYKTRVNDVYIVARERGIEVLTVAEYLGCESAFEQLGFND